MHGSFPSNGNKWAIAATVVSLGVALVLILAKATAWQLSGSAAILGSLADSFLDLLGSAIAFIGVRWAAEPADEDHRFGHHKAEAMAGLAQVILIVGSALFVLKEGIGRFLNPVEISSGQFAMTAMALSLILSLILVSFQTFAMRRSGSLAVEGDRAHYAGDAIANAGTLVAVWLAVQFNWLIADAIAGLLAAVFLLWAALSIGRKVVPQLMDAELPNVERANIIAIIKAKGGVYGVHALRTRKAGNRVYIQAHIELHPEQDLRSAHEIVERVETDLLKAYPGADILLHQDLHGQDEDHDMFGRRRLQPGHQ